jgi:hypothetical protein
MSVSDERRPGKFAFVREVLARDPRASHKAVNEAWRAAGHEGTISQTSFARVRAESKAPAVEPPAPRQRSKRGTAPRNDPAGASPAVAVVAPRPSVLPARERLAEELEADLDRILFKVMDAGDMPALERLIRQTRRVLIVGPR